MNKIIRKYFTFLILLYSNNILRAQDVLIYTTKADHLNYYLKSNTIKIEYEYIQGWIKLEPSADGLLKLRNKFIDIRKKSHEKTTGYSKYKYTLMLTQFNCNERKSKIVKMYDYDVNGNILDDHEAFYEDWQDIIPDSYGEKQLNYICNNYGK